ncbi:hypothetical protein CERSUDRAFT_117546 [Gelatoporia subvermispora B]|uniref:Enoyl reductase (ER) domain-containing protein n=1 Tax=Ceriporiopsis subvermispora (strain B) TaxID=914234 RepID=M2R559_CERS8|nr:hypothetical protein CERSUDRAFT_117546 [Gelatoporia subvermispora B]
MTTYSRVVLAERPKENITSSTFRTEVKKLQDLKPSGDEVLVQVQYLSLDPAMRGWLRDTRSYVPPVQIGEVMRAAGLGTVVEAGQNSGFVPGQTVSGTFGWTEYTLMKAKRVQKAEVATGGELLDLLGPLGMTGLTAYFGLLDVGKVKAGETLVVSGAAGATGSIVCQIGKMKGAKVIGIAGSDEKCRWLESELGVDKALNYKSPTYISDYKKHVKYFDVFFDNVGGSGLDFALTRMNQNARIVLCGAISDYNSAKPHGLQAYMSLISQRAKIEGFIVFDYEKQYPEALRELASWLKAGSLKRRFHVIEGLENAPAALPMLFSGGNIGKLVVKVTHKEKAKL